MSVELQIDTEELWGSVKQGHAKSLEILFRRHYAILYNYGLRLSGQEELVKDGIQEVFAYLWERRSTITISQSIRAYLLVSLRHYLLTALEKQNKRRAVHEEFTVENIEQAFSVEDLIIFQETKISERQTLEEAFYKIPTRMREALYLKTYDGLTYKEIATIMNVRPQVARNYVSEAFQRLRILVK